MRHTSRWAMALALAASTTLSAQTVAPPDVEQTAVTGPTQGTILENVCHLTSTRFPWGGGTSSAVLFEGRYLLTAGHNVFQDRSRLIKVEIRCGVTKAQAQIPCNQDPACHEVARGWQTMDAARYDLLSFPNQHDYGVIRLNTPIVSSTPVTLADAVPAAGAKVLLAGYPRGESVFDGKTLTRAEAQVRLVNKNDGQLTFNIRTFKGNSGGPVWQMMPDGSYTLIAIHIQPGEGRLVNDEFTTEIRRIMRVLDERAAKRGM